MCAKDIPTFLWTVERALDIYVLNVPIIVFGKPFFSQLMNFIFKSAIALMSQHDFWKNVVLLISALVNYIAYVWFFFNDTRVILRLETQSNPRKFNIFRTTYIQLLERHCTNYYHRVRRVERVSDFFQRYRIFTTYLSPIYFRIFLERILIPFNCILNIFLSNFPSRTW